MVAYVGKGLELVDTLTSPEIVASGLGRIEFLGAGVGCFVFYRRTIAPHTGKPELQVSGRLFLPMASIPDGTQLCWEALAKFDEEAGHAQIRRLLM